MDGALLLDKPVGLSSNRALQAVKRIYKVKKAGHAGTLDPLASGLLLVLFGEATKFAGPLLDADKEYIATVKLGERTATGDAEGEVTGRSDFRVAVRELEKIRFRAPLLELRVRCSKGTYIRTLAEDIAAALGTMGHLAALRRTASGDFQVKDAVTLGALEELDEKQRRDRLLALSGLLEGLPRAQLDPAAEGRFRNGQALPFEGPEGLCGVYGRDGVVGLGRATAGRLHPVRLTASQDAE